jgi:hypothetical protein
MIMLLEYGNEPILVFVKLIVGQTSHGRVYFGITLLALRFTRVEGNWQRASLAPSNTSYHLGYTILLVANAFLCEKYFVSLPTT